LFLSGLVYIINDIADVEAIASIPINASDQLLPDNCRSTSRSSPGNNLPGDDTDILLVVVLFGVWRSCSCSRTWRIQMAQACPIDRCPDDCLDLSSGGCRGDADPGSAFPWLYVVTTLGALYIGFGKRRRAGAPGRDATHTGECWKAIHSPVGPVHHHRVSYNHHRIQLYTFCDKPTRQPVNDVDIRCHLWRVPVSRLIQVKQIGGAPEDVLLEDRPLQRHYLMGLAILLIFYVF